MREIEFATTDIGAFGLSERRMAVELLEAWNEGDLPKEFLRYKVNVMMNKMSGNVFLTNEYGQVAMININKLEMWNQCGHCGNEGFEEDCQLMEGGCNECCK